MEKQLQIAKEALEKIANMELVEGAPTPEMLVARIALSEINQVSK